MSLDLSDIPPYVLSTAEGKASYTFTTINGTEYLIAFDDISSMYTAEDIGDSIIYEYQFFPTRDIGDEPYNERIMATVLYSISLTMQRAANILLYICDNSDQRGGIRSKYFDVLFHRNNKDHLIKIDGIVRASATHEELRYISVIVHPENPDRNKIDYTFHRVLFQADVRKDPSL